jgi:hypothetical protein
MFSIWFGSLCEEEELCKIFYIPYYEQETAGTTADFTHC